MADQKNFTTLGLTVTGSNVPSQPVAKFHSVNSNQPIIDARDNNGNNVFVVNSNKKVGINRISPAFELDVSGSARVDGLVFKDLFTMPSTLGDGLGSVLRLGAGDVAVWSKDPGFAAGSNTNIQFNDNGAIGSSNNLQFDGTFLKTSGLTVATSLIKTDNISKFVGINTAFPSYTLDVSGSANITGSLRLGSFLTVKGYISASGDISGSGLKIGSYNYPSTVGALGQYLRSNGVDSAYWAAVEMTAAGSGGEIQYNDGLNSITASADLKFTSSRLQVPDLSLSDYFITDNSNKAIKIGNIGVLEPATTLLLKPDGTKTALKIHTVLDYDFVKPIISVTSSNTYNLFGFGSVTQNLELLDFSRKQFSLYDSRFKITGDNSLVASNLPIPNETSLYLTGAAHIQGSTYVQGSGYYTGNISGYQLSVEKFLLSGLSVLSSSNNLQYLLLNGGSVSSGHSVAIGNTTPVSITGVINGISLGAQYSSNRGSATNSKIKLYQSTTDVFGLGFYDSTSGTKSLEYHAGSSGNLGIHSFYIGEQEKLRITSDGDLLVGTFVSGTNSIASIDVRASSSSKSLLSLSSSYSSPSEPLFVISDNLANESFKLEQAGTKINLHQSGSLYVSGSIHVNGAGVSHTILGNVGINTSTPDVALDVSGSAKVNLLQVRDYYSLPQAKGVAGQFLQTDGAGLATWADVVLNGAIAVQAAGSDTHIQYNNGGYLGASADFKYNNSAKLLTISSSLNVSDGLIYANKDSNRVGLGTTQPLAGLHNKLDGIISTGSLNVYGSTNSANTIFTLKAGTNLSGDFLNFYDNNDNSLFKLSPSGSLIIAGNSSVKSSYVTGTLNVVDSSSQTDTNVSISNARLQATFGNYQARSSTISEPIAIGIFGLSGSAIILGNKDSASQKSAGKIIFVDGNSSSYSSPTYTSSITNPVAEIDARLGTDASATNALYKFSLKGSEKAALDSTGWFNIPTRISVGPNFVSNKGYPTTPFGSNTYLHVGDQNTVPTQAGSGNPNPYNSTDYWSQTPLTTNPTLLIQRYNAVASLAIQGGYLSGGSELSALTKNVEARPGAWWPAQVGTPGNTQLEFITNGIPRARVTREGRFEVGSYLNQAAGVAYNGNTPESIYKLEGSSLSVLFTVDPTNNRISIASPIEGETDIFTKVPADYQGGIAGSTLGIGTTTQQATATPKVFSIGGDYSTSTGIASNAKIKIFDNGSNYYAFNVTGDNSHPRTLEYHAGTSVTGKHSFYTGLTKTLEATSTQVSVNGKLSVGASGSIDVKLLVTGSATSSETITKIKAGAELTTGNYLVVESYDNNPIFHVSSSGDVGIGTSNTDGYKLYASGSVRVDGLNVNGEYTLPTTDGTIGQVLKTDGSGVVYWELAGGNGALAAAGVNKNIQYNDNGIISADADFNYDTSTNTFSVLSASINKISGSTLSLIADSSVPFLVKNSSENSIFALTSSINSATLNLSASLVLSGAAYLSGNISNYGNLFVTNDIDLSGSIKYQGNNLLSSTTLASTVITSSLKKLGNLDSLTVNGLSTFNGAVDFNSTFSLNNDLNVDSGTLFVDSALNRVGIGTTATDKAKLAIYDSPNQRTVYLEALGSTKTSYLDIATSIYSGWSNAPPMTFRIQGDNQSSAHLVIRAKTQNPVSLSTSDAEIFRLTSTGSIGLGTDSPVYPIHIKSIANRDATVYAVSTTGNVSSEFRAETDNGAQFRFGLHGSSHANGTYSYLYGTGNQQLRIYTNSTERARFTTGGSFLLNYPTANADEKLVVQTSGSYDTIKLVNLAISQSTNIRFYNGYDDRDQTMVVGYFGPGQQENSGGQHGYIATAGAYPLKFYTGYDSDKIPRMTISNDGQITARGPICFLGNRNPDLRVQDVGADVFFYVSGSVGSVNNPNVTDAMVVGGNLVVSGAFKVLNSFGTPSTETTIMRLDGGLEVGGILRGQSPLKLQNVVGVGITNPIAGFAVASEIVVGPTYSTLTGTLGGALFEGKVGIGTTQPEYSLDIFGSSRITGSLNVEGGISGSLTRLTDGTPYLIAGTNISISTGSNGSITINSLSGFKSYEFTNATSINFIHSLGNRLTDVEIFDQNYYKIFPKSIELVNENTALITFSEPTSGFVISGNGVIGSGKITANPGSFSGNGSSSTFTLSAGYTQNQILVFVNGFYFHPGEDYTVSGTSLIFTETPTSGSQIRVRYLGT